MKQLSLWARAYIAAVIVMSLGLIAHAIPLWNNEQTLRFLVLFSGAFLASGLRVTLPGISAASP